MSYNFSLLNESIIRSLWETGQNFALKNSNQVILVELEIRFKDTKGLKIKYQGSEITKMHQFQYRASQKQEKGVYFLFQIA